MPKGALLGRTLPGVALALFATACGGGDDGSGGGGGGWNGEKGSIWTAASSQDLVVRIDAKTGKVVASHDVSSVGSEPTSIAIGEGSAWFAMNGHDQVGRVTPQGAVEATDASGAYEVVFGEGAVWASAGAQFLLRIDPKTGKVSANALVASGIIENPLAVGAGAVWVSAGDSIDRFDAATTQLSASIPIDGAVPKVQLYLSPVAFGEGALWILAYPASAPDTVLVKIDAATNAIVATKNVAVEGASGDIAVAQGSVWISDEYNARLLQLDPTSLEIKKEFAVPDSSPGAIAAGVSRIYMSDFKNAKVWSVDPATGAVASIDTASASDLTFHAD